MATKDVTIELQDKGLLITQADIVLGNLSAIKATNRQVLVDTLNQQIKLLAYNKGMEEGKPLLHVEIQGCGEANYMTIDDIPHHSVPCPCGNPKHWLIKYEEETRMTKGEFEKGYAKRSGLTVDKLHKLGLKAYPCDCNEEDCQGWQILSGQGAV